MPAECEQLGLRAAQRFHHAKLLAAGVRIVEHPAMLHAKAFVRDREDVLAGTCNLEAWSLRRFFEIDVPFALRRSPRSSTSGSAPRRKRCRPPDTRSRARRSDCKAAAFAAISPLL